jgi:hypothetical protein
VVSVDVGGDESPSNIVVDVDLAADVAEEGASDLAIEGSAIEMLEDEIEVSTEISAQISAQEKLSDVAAESLAADALENEAASDVILDDVAMMADTNLDEKAEADAEALTPFKPESDNEHK